MPILAYLRRWRRKKMGSNQHKRTKAKHRGLESIAIRGALELYGTARTLHTCMARAASRNSVRERKTTLFAVPTPAVSINWLMEPVMRQSLKTARVSPHRRSTWTPRSSRVRLRASVTASVGSA
jgi:hypothetical protein